MKSINLSGASHAEKRAWIWKQLSEQDIVRGALPEMSDDQSSVNQAWYIRILLGFAGWLGALFMMGFVGIGLKFAMDNLIAGICIGIALCTLSYTIFKSAKNNDFAQQFGLAMSLAGQGFFILALFQHNHSQNSVNALVILVFEILLTFFIPNFIHRFLTTMAAIYAVYFLLQESQMASCLQGLLAIGLASAWWSTQILRQPAIWRPIAFALAIALVMSEGGRFVSWFEIHSAQTWWLKNGWYLGTSMVNLSFIVSTLLLLRREQISFRSLLGVWAISGALVIAAFAYVVTGLSAASLLILIAFSFSNRVLLGLGFIAMLSYLAHYYYQMQVTLLYKSIVLAVLACTLFLVRLIVHRVFPQSPFIVEPMEELNA
ncbi:DUF4401 domain-containing protein [Undibacterium fentianense]|uniref:DUF4401 domain-containing protein n=1 Tax=Undibacterium fentianense TaxID=2828728 RepID=A0A941II86_9BURK|nr:DUF4401 domain-containing protein [Undibacterium fentianense]MBR7801705.1 DUF4401 domain-containing protein [Undibacterium fentianense]